VTDDAKAPATAPPATSDPPVQLPPTAADFAAKAQDLDALRTAVVEAAGVGTGLWFSYLFVLFYLLVAAGSVSHRDLLLETPIKLPFLGVELPLVGFFLLGPLLFLIAHAYVLLHFVLLAGKVGVFHAELQAQIADEALRARLRRQLPSNIFVQFLAGPLEVRSGVVGAMLRLIAYISLVGGPLALLVFFQLQFLPYHHDWVTWWHRLAIVADLALLWMLWPAIARGNATWIGWGDLRRPKVATAALVSVATVLMMFAVVTYPGEWLHEKLPSVRVAETSLHELLLAGKVDFITRKPKSLFSNRLVLPALDVVGAKFDTEAKIAAASETLSLRGRHLEGAVLIGARLRKVDFAAVRLRDAQLFQADLRDAKFDCVEDSCPDLRGAQLDEAQLQGVSFHRVRLQDASLQSANLQGVSLDNAQLQGARFALARMSGASLERVEAQGASFHNTELTGASLDGARLQGASLDIADLQGASLAFARLHGASFDSARLQGASLRGAQLQGAFLYGAKLQGAVLDQAQLQGASLVNAELQGASLKNAKLHGAFLNATQLQGASFENAELYGATFVRAKLQGAALDQAYLLGTSFHWVSAWRTSLPAGAQTSVRIVEPEAGPPRSESREQSFTALKRLIEEQVPAGPRRDQALRQIAILDPAAVDEKAEAAMAMVWENAAKHPPPIGPFQDAVAQAIENSGCDRQAAPHVASRLIHAIVDGTPLFAFDPGTPYPGRIAALFLDETRCPGARGLSAQDKEKLTRIRDFALANPAPASAER
jgi:uncharacterized protein YjbI with pentapeptide repeats